LTFHRTPIVSALRFPLVTFLLEAAGGSGLQTAILPINLTVEVCANASSAPAFALALAAAVPLALTSNITVLVQPSVAFCGDGIKQTVATSISLPGGGIYQEECDNGESNGLGSCSPSCACSLGFLASSGGICTCTRVVGLSASASESNRARGETNEITVRLVFKDTVLGLIQAGGSGQFLTSPVVVTISNLTGSLTPDEKLPLLQCGGAEGWVGCGLGLAPAPGTIQWRAGWADWQQSSGTLRFTVLQSIKAGASAGTVKFSFSLRNSAELQYARAPVASACTGLPFKVTADISAPILGSNVIKLAGPAAQQSLQILKRGADGTSMAIAQAEVGALGEGVNLTLEVLEIWHLSSALRLRLQVGAAFAGRLETAAINSSLQGTGLVGQPVLGIVKLSIFVNQSVVRVRGGCSVIANGALNVCLPGFVGMFLLDARAMEWRAVNPLNESTFGAVYVQATAEVGKIVAAIALPPCINVDGQGMPAGDKVDTFELIRLFS
jgi:hypothetical protein